MSVSVRVEGTIGFEEADTMNAHLDELKELDEEVSDFVGDGLVVEAAALRFQVDGTVTNNGNLELQMWLEDVVEEASSGSVDVWQDDVGVRVHAGGRETDLP